MSTPTKTRVVTALLLFVAIWPAAHHALARQLEFDPWKFFGWSMFAVPDPVVEVRVAELTDSGVRRLDWTPELTRTVREYAERRATLGALLPPDRLAREIFEMLPEVQGLSIIVARRVIERRSARIVTRETPYGYRRQAVATRSTTRR